MEQQERGEAEAEAEAEAGISLHHFSGRLGEQVVHFQAMRLRDSLFLWVGSAPLLGSLAVAMCSPRVSAGPSLGSGETPAPSGSSPGKGGIKPWAAIEKAPE